MILITGATSFIGNALAEKNLATGEDLLLVDRNENGLKAMEKRLRTPGQKIEIFPCDISLEIDVKALRVFLGNHVGEINAFYNNILPTPLNPFSDNAMDLFQYCVVSTIHITKAVLPSMLMHNQGQIIHIITHMPYGHAQSIFEATKGAIKSYTNALSKELATSYITVNTIDAQYIDTPFVVADKDLLSKQKFRLSFAQDVAEMALFLGSTEAKNITGQILSMGHLE